MKYKGIKRMQVSAVVQSRAVLRENQTKSHKGMQLGNEVKKSKERQVLREIHTKVCW